MSTQNKTKKWSLSTLWTAIQLDRARKYRHAEFNPYNLSPRGLRRKVNEYKGTITQPFKL